MAADSDKIIWLTDPARGAGNAEVAARALFAAYEQDGGAGDAVAPAADGRPLTADEQEAAVEVTAATSLHFRYCEQREDWTECRNCVAAYTRTTHILGAHLANRERAAGPARGAIARGAPTREDTDTQTNTAATSDEPAAIKAAEKQIDEFVTVLLYKLAHRHPHWPQQVLDEIKFEAQGELYVIEEITQYTELAETLADGAAYQAERDIARAEVKRLQSRVAELEATPVDWDTQRRRADRAEAAIERVRKLHTRGPTTHTCNEDGAFWPCETIRALVLDGSGQPTGRGEQP